MSIGYCKLKLLSKALKYEINYVAYNSFGILLSCQMWWKSLSMNGFYIFTTQKDLL